MENGKGWGHGGGLLKETQSEKRKRMEPLTGGEETQPAAREEKDYEAGVEG